METSHLIGITDLRSHAKDVIDRLDERPVTILSRSKPVGVLVHPGRWEQLLDRIDELEAQVAVLDRDHDVVSLDKARDLLLAD